MAADPAWTRLRARILDDPTLQERLRATAGEAEFAAAAEAAAGETVALDGPRSAALRAWIEREVPGPAPELRASAPSGWTPIHVAIHGERPWVEWCDLRGLDFSRDAFFQDTVQAALSEPYRLLTRTRTPLDALADLPAAAPPAGLIMHLSRCGSTLACRMLATDPSLVVVSEPPALDQLLRAPTAAADRTRWVAGLLAALGADGRRLVLKTDAWSLLDFDVLRAAAPGVPWAMLTREPAEIIASQLREPGSSMIPGVIDVGVDLAVAASYPREQYCALVLRRLTDAARVALDERAVVVDYARMPTAVADALAPHFGVRGDRDRMLAAADRDAKRPYETFDAEGSRAERPVTAEVRAAAATVGVLG